MKFSLVLATLNRTGEVQKFLECLMEQSHKDFEVILVDQNKDDRLNLIVEPFKSLFTIQHVFSEPGLSRARNEGLKYISGDVIAFPDDDCLYPREMLARIANCFVSFGAYDGLLIRMRDSLHYKAQSFDHTQKKVDKIDVFATASICIFVRMHVLEQVKGFDESMGLGAKSLFTGGEDYDFVLNAMSHRNSFYYDGSIEVLHPIKNPDDDPNEKNYYKRIEAAGISDFLLLKRYFSFPHRMIILGNNLLGVVYFLFRRNKFQYHMHYYRCRGMLKAIKQLKTL